MYFLGVLGFILAKTLAPHITDNNSYDRKRVMHYTSNNAKMENDRYTYSMFNKVLPLALNLSSMHTEIFPDFIRQFRFYKRKVSLSRIIDHSNWSSIIPLLVHYE